MQAMVLAIEEGKKGAGFVSPNPLVGCVILDRQQNLIGKGYHARVGEAHAEINAVNSVADKSKLEGAHLFVTLEPCAHVGRTPACAQALAALPLASVTYGLEDPNPLVSGRGAEILRQAGKRVVEFSGLKRELGELAEIFLTNVRMKRPFVALKVASSLDGKIAFHDGSSQWITGEAARQHVQFLRGCYDSVLVGHGTFEKDNPRLNSRSEIFASKPQRAVILDPEGRSFARLKDSALLQVRNPADVFIVTGPGIKGAPEFRHLQVRLIDGGFDLGELLQQLQSEGVHSVLVEGGAHAHSAFLRSHLVDRIYVFLAPKIMGDAKGWTSGLHFSGFKEALVLNDTSMQAFGTDWLISGRPFSSTNL